MKYDVIVVGGRVGGSVSSFFASKNDLDVLMIEKQQEIGIPVQCAGVTYAETFEILEMKPSKRFTFNTLNGADIYAPDLTRVRMDIGKANGFVLDRKVFDKNLAIESAKAGTDIMVKTTVKDLIIKEGKVKGVTAKHLGKTIEIESDLVIAADGIESNIARMAGLNTLNNPKDIASCAQYEMVGVDVDPDYSEFYFGNEVAPGGYAWIFPKGDDIANIGLGIRNSKETAYHYLKKFVSKMDGTPVELNVGGAPLSGPVDKTFTEGLMVVGDAAKHVDPISGEGIRQAVICGKIAGEVAAEAIKKENTSAKFLKKYEKLWKKEIGNDLKNSLKYKKVFDKLDDNDLNTFIKFIQDKNITDINSISTMVLLEFIKEHPKFLKVLRAIL
jgi:digeranylgeranylglycerophospholipid reductase